MVNARAARVCTHIEPASGRLCDEMHSQQTDTLSCALVEAYKNNNLIHEEIIIGEQLIAQGRYWHRG